jgi:hypothetical protein
MLLAGCGGSQTPSTGNAWLLPVTTSSSLANGVSNDLAGKSRLFVADNAASQIVTYAANMHNPGPLGRISDGVHKPYNLAVDQNGTLYVQNGNNTITEYIKGQKAVSKTLKEPGGSITATALTVGNDGTVYAGSGAGEVFEFADGSTKPTKTLHCCVGLLSTALDSKNDLFVSWAVAFNGDGVEEFKPGRKVGKRILSNVLAGAIAVDSHDNLLVVEGYQIIRLYKPGSKTPFRKIRIGGWGDVWQLAFDSDETYLYIPSCKVQSCGQGEVKVYDYKTGKLAWTVWKGLRGGAYGNGVALWPPAPR